MTKRKTEKAPLPAKADPTPSPHARVVEYLDNMDLLHSRLAQANATLDLLHLSMPNQETAEDFIERVNWLMLSTAIYGVLEGVREAQAAAERIPKQRVVLDLMEDGAHG